MDFGKFASAEELLKSYNQLEKSFTQKCQQLSALEREKGKDLAGRKIEGRYKREYATAREGAVNDG